MTTEAFGGRILRKGTTALLVVDATNGFTRPGGPLSCDAETAVGAAARLIEAARASAVPIAMTRVSYSPDRLSAGARVFRAKVPALELLEDTWEASIDDRLAPLEGETIFTKELASAFFGTDLEDWLHRREISVVVVAGFSTSGCVRATVVDALQRGFVPIVVADAVADRDQESHRVALREMDARYADVVELPAALALLAPG